MDRHECIALLTRLTRSGGTGGACLIYTGVRDRQGYGQLPAIIRSPWGRTRKAHRLAFAITYGYLPGPGREVCHTCDNPPCCEALHLYDGTSQSNADDMVARGRSLLGRKLPAMNLGEDNHFAILNANKVRAIRTLRAEGASLQSLADNFGVSVPAVSMIVNRRTWRHVA